jgi:glucose-6-phosphate-specific signal transduction histidine kinase
MKTNVIYRLLLALFSILTPLWLMAQMPSGSAFATELSVVRFDMWQGALLASSLMVSAVMARFLTRS